MSVAEDIEAIKARLRVVEDIEMCKQLRIKWDYCVDELDEEKGRLDDLVNLFTEDGVLVLPSFAEFPAATYAGREAIRKYFEAYPRAFKQPHRFVHALTNPVIDINGDSASAKWYVLLYLSVGPEQPLRNLIRCRDTYQRIGNEWKIKRLEVDFFHVNMEGCLPDA